MIIASAIRTKDGVMFVGKRHGNCFLNADSILRSVNILAPEAKEMLKNCEQGFLTDTGNFLSRELAYEHAQKVKQIDVMRISHVLTSEDLW